MKRCKDNKKNVNHNFILGDTYEKSDGSVYICAAGYNLINLETGRRYAEVRTAFDGDDHLFTKVDACFSINK